MSEKDYITSGSIAKKAREYAVEIAKTGMTHLELVEKVEAHIKKLGGHVGFPMDVSIDSTAAHATPSITDTHILEKGQVAKLDIGVHVNGHVTDTATTVEIGNTTKWKELITAAHDAVKAGAEQAIPGGKIRNIGKAISQAIISAGFQPITNLSGHGVGEWLVHCPPTIPNFDNENNNTLEEGQTIAIEPFATTGVGSVKDGKPAGIYRLLQKKPVRIDSVRKVIDFIEKNYITLPFSPRWIKHLPNFQFALRTLEQQDIIKQYTELPESSGGMVSQAEVTVLVGKGIIT